MSARVVYITGISSARILTGLRRKRRSYSILFIYSIKDYRERLQRLLRNSS
jgi:hypothetical protein